MFLDEAPMGDTGATTNDDTAVTENDGNTDAGAGEGTDAAV